LTGSSRNRVEDVNWIHLAQDRDQWRALEQGTEPSVTIQGGEFLD